MKRHHLIADARKITGDKVSKLRKDGILPVDIYGKGMESLNVQVSDKEFGKVYRETGNTGLIDVKVGESVYPVLVKNVQVHPTSGHVLHVELHKVNLSEKIKANVPLELVGESPAVLNQIGIILQTLNEVEIEALPTDLLEKIEVDISVLTELDQQLTVADLPKTENAEILTPGEEVVVKVANAVVEEKVEEVVAPVVEGEEGAETPKDSEGEAGGTPATDTVKVEVKE